MSVKINIAKGLKKARKAAGRSVDDVGLVIGKSGKTISAWEVERGQPSGDELILICDYLGCHLSDFYGEEYTEYMMDGGPSLDELDEDEKEIITVYRNISPEGKRAVMTLIRGIEQRFGWTPGAGE